MDAMGQRALSIAQDLIRIDTTNTGDSASKGERQAAEYVVGLLEDCGYQPIYIESEPRRGSVLLRIEGHDAAKPPLILHGHLDVVPAQAERWTVDPFGGQISDGYLWGRGAVDMKNMVAMILALIEHWAASGQRPARDLLVGFFADEEAGGRKGAHWLIDHHPDFFIGAEEAVGEVGGFSTMVAGQRAYLLQTAEKGIAWLQLVATGTAGHGSARNPDNAVVHLVDALTRVRDIAWPIRWTETVRRLLSGAAELAGLNLDLDDPDSVEAVLAAFGPASRWVAPSIATSCNLTGLEAGDKVNVVPDQASALLDIRPLPGQHNQVFDQVGQAAGRNVRVETVNIDTGLEAPIDSPIVQAMTEALAKADPKAVVLPYMLPAGTDAKALSRLGIAGYGFTPMQLPPSFDFTAMFHGIDERVPVQTFGFGTGVLGDFLATY